VQDRVGKKPPETDPKIPADNETGIKKSGDLGKGGKRSRPKLGCVVAKWGGGGTASPIACTLGKMAITKGGVGGGGATVAKTEISFYGNRNVDGVR